MSRLSIVDRPVRFRGATGGEDVVEGGFHAGAVDGAEADPSDVALVEDVDREHLEDDREAEVRRRIRCFGRGLGVAGANGRDSGGGEDVQGGELVDGTGGEGRGGEDGRAGASVPEEPCEAHDGRDRVRRRLVDGNPHRLDVAGVVRGAEPRHREVLVGVRALPLDPGSAGRFHQGEVSPDRILEADEAPVVPVRRGELDRLVEEGRVVEELAGDVGGVRAAANGPSSSMRRYAASGISGNLSPHRFASSAISTPTPPETVTIATRSLAGSVPMT